MKITQTLMALAGCLCLAGCMTSKPEMMGNLHQELDPESFYLPKGDAARVVTVTTNGIATANILVQTQRVAVKECAVFQQAGDGIG
jgi:hypothetical protein